MRAARVAWRVAWFCRASPRRSRRAGQKGEERASPVPNSFSATGRPDLRRSASPRATHKRDGLAAGSGRLPVAVAVDYGTTRTGTVELNAPPARVCTAQAPSAPLNTNLFDGQVESSAPLIELVPVELGQYTLSGGGR